MKYVESHKELKILVLEHRRVEERFKAIKKAHQIKGATIFSIDDLDND